MTSNANTNVTLPNLSFSTSTVRGAIIDYTVYRNTSTNTVSETGQLWINYNPSNPTGNKWEISREYVGDAQTTFSITDVGQVQFSTTLLSGINFNGTLTYQAKAILQS